MENCILNNPLDNSKLSDLHKGLTELYATPEEASDMWTYLVSEDFEESFGNWKEDYKLSDRTFKGRTYANGEPELKFNASNLPYIELENGSKFFLKRRVLDIDPEEREDLVNITMFQLFSKNTGTDSEIFSNADINSIFTNKEPLSIYDILDGNMVDLKDVYTLVKQRLNLMKVKVIEREDINDPDSTVTREDTENGKVLDLQTSQEKNSKDNATSNIKFLMSFIPTEDGRFAKFDYVWKRVEPVLANTVDLYNGGVVMSKFETMMSKLRDNYSNDPVIMTLVNTIESMPEFKQNQFVQALDKIKNNYQTGLLKKTPSGITYKFFSSDRAVTVAKKNINNWNANFKQSKLISSDPITGQPSLTKGDNGKTFASMLYNGKVKGYKTLLNDISNAKNTDPVNEDLYKRLKEKLEFIGITIQDNGLREFIYGGNPNADQIITNGMLFSAAHKIEHIFKHLSTLKNEDVVKGLNIQNIFSGRDIGGRVTALAEAQTKYSNDLTESTIMGAESKKYWIYSMPSFLTNKLERLKQDTESELPLDNAFYGYSIILNKFRDNLKDPGSESKYIDQLELLMFNNFREENEGDEGSDNSGMIKQDQIVDNINKALNAMRASGELSVYYTPIPADKSKLYHIKGSHFFRTTDSNDAFSLHYDALFVYENYLIDELHRIQEELKLLEDIEGNKDKLYKDYHYKLNKAGVPNYYAYDEVVDGETKQVLTNKTSIEGKTVYPVGNAFKSILFPEFSPFDQSDKVKALEIFDSNGNLKVNTDTLRGNEAVRSIIDTAIQDTISSEYDSLVNQGLIVDEKDVRTFKALDTNIMSKYKSEYTGDDAIRAAVSDYIVNSMIANIEFSKVFSGDYAFYKDLSDLSKRYPATYTDGVNINLKKGDNPNFKLAVLPNVTLPSYALEAMEAHSPALAKAYSNINTTDAQGYITLDRWHFVMSRSNHWNPTYEAAYQRIKDGNPTTEDYKYAAQPIKGVHFEVTDGVPTYIKYSAAVLIPSVIKGTDLEKLNNDMIAQGIDEAVVIDGIKVGAKVPSDILEGDRYKSGKFNSITLRNHNYKIQQDLRPKGIKQTLLGSQIKKTILTNFKDDEEYGGILGKDLKQEIFDILSAKSDFGLRTLQRDLGIDHTGKILNKEKLTATVLKQISSRGITENLQSALQKEYDFDYIANYRQKIQNSLMSVLNDATVNVKTNGASFIQTSSQFLNNEDVRNSGIKLLVDDYTHLNPPTIYTDKDGNKKVTPGQVFVTSNYIAKFIPNWKKLSPDQLKEMIDSRLLRMIGYRIPNQGMSSNASLEIVGILPESYADTIIPYIDITTQTGSDFDIDKMYVMIPNAKPRYRNRKDMISDLSQLSEEDLLDILTQDSTYSQDYVDSLTKNKKKAIINLASEIVDTGLYNWENGTVKPVIESLDYINYDKAKSPLDQSESAVDNRLMELMQIILEDEKTYDALMQPLDNPFIKDDIEFLHGKEDSSKLGSKFFSPLYQIDKKFDNSGGKTGVGLTANQLTDHMWTQHVGLKYIDNIGFTNIKDAVTSFDGEYDILGENKITDVLSWFLTAYVDIAKDPYITRGNHNEYTSNTTFMLLRGGAPISFINRLVGQPVVKKLAEIDSLRKSRIADIDRRELSEAVIEELGLNTEINYLNASTVIDRFNSIGTKEQSIKKNNKTVIKLYKEILSQFSFEEIKQYANLHNKDVATDTAAKNYFDREFNWIFDGDSEYIKNIKWNLSQKGQSSLLEQTTFNNDDMANADQVIALEIEIANKILNYINNNYVPDTNIEGKAEAVKKYNDRMEKDIRNPQPTDPKWQARQLEYLDLYNHYHKIGQDFSSLVLSSKQDVGGNKDFISAYTNRNKRNEATSKDFSGFMGKFNNTFLGTAYENSTELSIRIMEQLFVTSNRSAQVVYDSVYRLISPNAENGLVEPKLGFEMEKSYFAHILGQSSMARNNDEIREMFIGNNTIYDRILQARLVNPDNYLINTMLDVEQVDGIKFVKMDSTKNNSSEALDEISRSWEDLFDSEDPNEVQLAEDLIVYSFYQSAFRSNIGSFFEHIPTEPLKNLVEAGLAEAKHSISGGNVGLSQFVDKYFRNNWQDNRLVPFVTSKGMIKTGVLTVSPEQGTERGKYKMPYVKTSEGYGDAKTTVLWKNMGYMLNDKGHITSAKFVKVSKLGYNNNGRTIYEYTKSIPVDGNSMWIGNNIKNNDIVKNKVLSTVDQKFNVITDDRAMFHQIQTNNRDQDNDMGKANEDGLIKCTGQ